MHRFVFLYFFGSFFFILPVVAQDLVLNKKVTLEYSAISIEALLDSIHARYGVDFSCDVDVVPVDSVVSVNVFNQTLLSTLELFLNREKINIYALEHQVVINRKQIVQEYNRSIKIEGEVCDFRRGRPMAIVNIGLVGETIGTITNSEGQFEFLIPEGFIGQKVSVSSIGYLSEAFFVPSEDTIVKVFLAETSVHLPQVEIIYENAQEIVEKVRANISINYPDESLILSGFFRESIKQADDFVEVSEAVVEILKPTYSNPFDLERVRFIRGRKINTSSVMDKIRFRLEGGPFHFSRIDIARYAEFLPSEGRESTYVYFFKGVDMEYDRPVYRVGFRPAFDSGELLYSGELRIDVKSYALVSASFEMSRNTLKKSRSFLIRKESRKFKAKPFYAKYYINYRPYNNRWVLNKVRGELKVRVVDRRQKLNSIFSATTEMLISDLRMANKTRFRSNEIFKANYFLAEEVNDANPAFWENYNIIKPEEAIEQVFRHKGNCCEEDKE